MFQPAPKGHQKVILATNIVETSVTINDVVYVIDSGRVKQVILKRTFIFYKCIKTYIYILSIKNIMLLIF